jgi:WD40 repeat protein
MFGPSPSVPIDGQHIVSGSCDKLVKVWSVSARKEVASLAGHTGYVISIAFSPDGQHIVSGSVDKLVKVWSVSGWKEVASLAGYTNVVFSVAHSPDGQHIVSGSGDNLVKWSVSGRKEVASGWTYRVRSVAFSPDGQHIVSGSGDKVKVWSVSARKEVASLPVHANSVCSVALISDGQHIVQEVMTNWEGVICVWREGGCVAGWTHECCFSVAFSPDRQHIVSGSCDKLVEVWS